jgi:hypothetical protein
MLNCKEANKAPRIEEISIKAKDRKTPAYIKVKHDTAPEIIAECLNSDSPHGFKEYQLAEAKREIKYSLAGIAGEFIQLGITGKFEYALTVFYKKEKKDTNSDLSKAIAYNVAIGRQTYEDGVLPLVSYLEATVRDVLTYWDEIIEIAIILQNDKVISEDKIEALTHNLFNQ